MGESPSLLLVRYKEDHQVWDKVEHARGKSLKQSFETLHCIRPLYATLCQNHPPVPWTRDPCSVLRTHTQNRLLLLTQDRRSHPGWS